MRADSRLILACAADERYALPLGIMLYSVMRHYRGTRSVEIYILDGGLTPRSRTRIESVLKPFMPTVVWLHPDNRMLNRLPLRKNLTISAYYRLLLPELLPANATKEIYLDADILAGADIGALWETDVRDYYLLAARDGDFKESRLVWLDIFDYTNDTGYFNSGVLVINIDKMRKENFLRRALAFGREHADQINQSDQDVLNAMSFGAWEELDPVWNWQVKIGKDGSPFRYRKDVLLHFVGGKRKPWESGIRSRFNAGALGVAYEHFDRYLRESGWFSDSGWLRYRVNCLLARSARRIGSAFCAICARPLDD